MNGRTAKKIRRKAREAMLEYVLEAVLTEEQVEEAKANGYTNTNLYLLLPPSLLLSEGFTRKQGLGTQKWFYKWAKKCYNNTTDNKNWREYYEY